MLFVMKSLRLPRISALLPRRGNVFVTVTAVDENGFAMQYEQVEVPISAFRTGVAAIHIAATESSAARADHARCFDSVEG